MAETRLNLIPAVAKQVNRPFTEKLAETQTLIARNIATHKNPAVAWSGGKDSTLVLWLCQKLKPDILAVFNNTGVEYPETVRFVHQLRDEWKVNLIETQPFKSFWECAKEYGMPTKKDGKGHQDHCCYYTKEKPNKMALKKLSVDCEFTGLTACENRNRMFASIDHGVCFHSKTYNLQLVHPIMWWTEDEVRQFHADMNIPLNPMYSKGCDRVGCMPCTAFKSWESQLSQTNPKMYRYLKLRKDKQHVMEGIF